MIEARARAAPRRTSAPCPLPPTVSQGSSTTHTHPFPPLTDASVRSHHTPPVDRRSGRRRPRPGATSSTSSSPHRRAAAPPPTAPTASSLDPVEFDGKTFQLRDYVWLCLALGLSPQGYMLPTLGLALGLTWEWCLAAALGAALVAAPLAAATSHPTAKYGIPFCVALRPAFGRLGARLPGLLAALLALPWCAWLLLLAARALTAGIARVRLCVGVGVGLNGWVGE